MTLENEILEEYVKTKECPGCRQKTLYIYYAYCSDPECCGDNDSLSCRVCSWETYICPYDISDVEEALARR